MTPELTVVVPTHDRPDALARCLAALGGQNVVALEIVVVDDGSSKPEHIAAIVGREPRAKLVRLEGSGPAAARNAGVQAARGRLIAFTDDDCEPQPGWAAALVAALAHAPVAGGLTLNGRPESACVTAAERIRSHLEEFTRARNPGRGFIATNNLACVREVAFELPFDEGYGTGGEDRDWCARAAATGRTLSYAPAAVVRHLPNLDLSAFWRQQVRFGRGAYRFHRSRPQGEREHRQPPFFYVQLLRDGFRDGFRPGLLVALSQVATGVGLVREALASRSST